MTPTDTKAVEKLEGRIGRAVAEIIMRPGLNRLPLRPSRRTMHPMVKAVGADSDPLEACERSAEKEDRVQGGLADRIGTVGSGAWM